MYGQLAWNSLHRLSKNFNVFSDLNCFCIPTFFLVVNPVCLRLCTHVRIPLFKEKAACVIFELRSKNMTRLKNAILAIQISFIYKAMLFTHLTVHCKLNWYDTPPSPYELSTHLKSSNFTSRPCNQKYFFFLLKVV